MDENQKTNKKRKYYPGDVRRPGTKEYSMILGNLINYKHQLVRENHEQVIGELLLKISVKLKELGFKAASESVKKKVGRKKAGKFQNITSKKKDDTVLIAVKAWDEGSDKNERAKVKAKQKEL